VHAIARAGRGVRLVAKNSPADATWRASLRLEPGQAAYLDTLGWALYKNGQHKAAAARLGEAVAAAPNVAELRAHLAEVWLKLGDLPAAMPQLLEHADKPVVAHCHLGLRSRQAATFLRQQGFEDVRSMTGGIDAWSVRIDPRVPRY
jgi:adenylyltransferase/sulfurtransferase